MSVFFLALLTTAAVAVGIYVITVHNAIIENKNSTTRSWSDMVAYQHNKLQVMPEIEKAFNEYQTYEKAVMQKMT